jgi:UDP-4-amino-4-deoxy-L-arabinose-oxoglutarate aminotransferase
MDFLPFALPSIDQDEIDEVIDTLKSNWITTGPKTKQFENDFSNLIGAENAIAVNSCTAALHLALDAIGLKEGDKVITTPFTFTASAEVIRYLGADPIFVDIDPGTFNIDADKLNDVIKSQKNQQSIKAIIPVHFAGQSCDMDSIIQVAKKYNLKIIEDAAHALPTTYNGKKVGCLGDIACFSFYATKTITTGEGGMVVTDNPEYASRIKTMRLHGISKDVFNRYTSNDADWYYEVVEPGFKYNMPDIAAAIGIHQLKKVYDFYKRRKEIAESYNEALIKLAEVEIPFVKNPVDIHSWHLYVIKLRSDKLTIGRDDFLKKMKEMGIGTSVHFIPLHIQPYYRDKYSFKANDYPIAYDVFKHIFSLPIYPKMLQKDVNRVIDAVTSLISKYKK